MPKGYPTNKEQKNPKKFRCDQCDAGCTSLYGLKRHKKRVHKDQSKRLKCSCGQKFRDSEGLDGHLRRSGHAELPADAAEIPAEQSEEDSSPVAPDSDGRFHCKEEGCTKSYSKRIGLTRHQQKHTGQRYVCACGDTFARVDSLTRHRKKSKKRDCKKPPNEYRCKCGDVFNRWQNWRDHTNRFRAPAECRESAEAATSAASAVVINPVWPTLVAGLPDELSRSLRDSDNQVEAPQASTTSLVPDYLSIKLRARVDPRRMQGVHSWNETSLIDGTVRRWICREMRDILMPSLDPSLIDTPPDCCLEFFDELETGELPDGRPTYFYEPELDLDALYDQLSANAGPTALTGSAPDFEEFDESLDLTEDELFSMDEDEAEYADEDIDANEDEDEGEGQDEDEDEDEDELDLMEED